MRVTNRYGESAVSADLKGRQLLVNDRSGAFGSGWGSAGLQRLYPQADHSIMVVDGDGEATRFRESSFRFDDFADLSKLVLNGVAQDLNTIPVQVNGRTVLRLTHDSGFQSGSAFLSDPVDLLHEGAPVSFETHFKFQINEAGGWDGGGDGMTFALVTKPNSLGGTGGDLGFGGVEPSLAVEFDTFQNDYDPNGNHIGIDLNGDVVSAATYTLEQDLLAGDVWSVWIDYLADASRLEVRIAPKDIRPDAPQLSYIVNLAEVLGQPRVYAGFTAGAAFAYGDHDVNFWEYSSSISGEGETTYSPPKR